MNTRTRRIAAVLGAALVLALALVPVIEAQTDYRFIFPVGIRSNNTGAALFVRQDGSGSIATFRDGATDEYTFDQSSATFVNPLTLSGGSTIPGSITNAIDNENVGNLPTIDSAAIITSTNGATWTVGASETWLVHNVFCEITTNFDCTGNDCQLKIGDGNNDDGFLLLADAALQAADTEGTGFAAGWQGLYTDTIGAYLYPGGGFIYAATDTIDIDIRDVSGGTNPTAGAGTCYIRYTRFE